MLFSHIRPPSSVARHRLPPSKPASQYLPLTLLLVVSLSAWLLNAEYAHGVLIVCTRRKGGARVYGSGVHKHGVCEGAGGC